LFWIDLIHFASIRHSPVGSEKFIPANLSIMTFLSSLTFEDTGRHSRLVQEVIAVRRQFVGLARNA